MSIDDDPKINNLARYECDNDIERAHVFINRTGAIFLAHDFTVPWRATKFETAKNFGSTLKGLFLHIELIQPRRALKGYGRRNDFLAPDPGFSQAQYDSLALVYAVASRRAGFWLIPAFHSVLDEGIRNKHDDPQNFELETFAASLDHLVGELRTQDGGKTAIAICQAATPKPRRENTAAPRIAEAPPPVFEFDLLQAASGRIRSIRCSRLAPASLGLEASAAGVVQAPAAVRSGRPCSTPSRST